MFKKIMLLCMILVLTYTVVIFAVTINKDQEYKNKLLVTKSEQLADSVREELDKKINFTATIVAQLSQEKEILDYINGSAADAYNMLRARDRLSDTVSSFLQLGCRFDLYRPDSDTVITSNRSTDIVDYLNEMGANEEIFYNTLKSLSLTTLNNRFVMYPERINSALKDESNILFIFKHQASLNNSFYSIVILDSNYLISNYGGLDNETLSLLYDKTPLFTIQHGDADIEEITVNLKEFESADGHKTYKGDMVKYTKSSVVDGLGVLLIMPKHNFFLENTTFILISFFGLLVSIILVGVLIYFFVKIIYRPVGSLVNEIGKTGEEKPRDEMQLIRNAFSEMRTNREELLAQLTDNEKHLREKLLKDLLYGISMGSEFENDVKRYGLDYLKDDISVTVVEYVEENHVKGFLGRDDINSVKSDILSYFKENLGFENGFELFEISNAQFVIITCGYGFDEIKRLLVSVVNPVEVCYNVKLLSSTGSLCQNLKNIQESFYDALNMLGYKNLFSSKNVVTMQNWQETNNYYYPLDVEKSLILYVQEGEKEKAFDILNNVINRNLSIGLNQKGIWELKLAMLVTARRIIQLYGKSMEEAAEKAGFDDYYAYGDKDIYDLAENLRKYFGVLADEAGKMDKKISSVAMKNLLDYIHKNYTRDVSLTEVAEYYDISPGYVGKLFRENMETTFKDYLNQYRINIAKKLLIDEPLTQINDIAERVGFTNVVTFNRVFKRYEMMAPGEYRKAQ